MSKAQQGGFTLIELVVVIVILGILAAFAVPRFMGMEGEARASTVKGMAGTLRSAAALAHAKCQAQGCTNVAPNNVITFEGQNVTMLNSYPNVATVELTVQDTSGFTITTNGGNRRFTKIGAAGANCWVAYVPATAAVPATVTFAPAVLAAGAVGSQAFNRELATQCN